MSELSFETSLSMEEIEKNFQDFDFFSEIMDGLKEALAVEKGTPSAETIIRKRSLPTVNTTEVRTALGMTQKMFADVLGVSRRTVESWESGRTTPTPTAKKLIYLLQEDHTLVQKLL